MKIKNKNNNFLSSFFLLFIILAAAGFVFLNIKLFYQRDNVQKRLTELNNRLSTLEKQNEYLSSRINSGNLGEFIERITRDDLNLRKEGETVLAIPLRQASSSSINGDTKPSKSFWETILGK